MSEDDEFDPVPLAIAIALACGLALIATGLLGLLFK